MIQFEDDFPGMLSRVVWSTFTLSIIMEPLEGELRKVFICVLRALVRTKNILRTRPRLSSRTDRESGSSVSRLEGSDYGLTDSGSILSKRLSATASYLWSPYNGSNGCWGIAPQG